MKKYLLSIFTLILPALTFAQEAADKGVDQIIDEKFGAATGWFVSFIFYQIDFGGGVKVFWVLFPLILGALYFTVYFKFINFRGILTSINIVRGKYDDIDHHESMPVAGDPTPGGDSIETAAIEGHEGEVSHFQALTAALSATVGLGNIARCCNCCVYWWSWSYILDDCCWFIRNGFKIC